MLVSLWETLDKAWYLTPGDFLKGEAGKIVMIKGSERRLGEIMNPGVLYRISQLMANYTYLHILSDHYCIHLCFPPNKL